MTLRKIEPLVFDPPLVPNVPPTERPQFATIAPDRLVVDDRYQRDITARGRAVIKKAIENFDWCKFKPPVVTKVGDAYHLIDGQHTSIIAITHGGLGDIPVMVVSAADAEARAAAFVGHNRDRVAMAPLQIYFSSLAAGEAETKEIADVCARAGVTILRSAPSFRTDMPSGWRPGETVAIGAIQRLVQKRFPLGARRVLEVLAKAGCAPLTVGWIKAVERLLFDTGFKGSVEADALAEALLSATPAVLESKGAQESVKCGIRQWEGMALVLYREATKGRRKPRVDGRVEPATVETVDA